jgi:outer membrane protein OmpA-like peptidoglycan-associated protein
MRERSFYVVAHLTGPQELEQLLNRSSIRAQTVRQQLINLGVDASQLIARGLGPLAPSCKARECLERVEIVLMQTID